MNIETFILLIISFVGLSICLILFMLANKKQKEVLRKQNLLIDDLVSNKDVEGLLDQQVIHMKKVLENVETINNYCFEQYDLFDDTYRSIEIIEKISKSIEKTSPAMLDADTREEVADRIENVSIILNGINDTIAKLKIYVDSTKKHMDTFSQHLSPAHKA